MAMKTINIEVSDSVYEHIMFFLKNLPKDVIRFNKKQEISTKDEVKKLFENSDIKAFQDIEDPLVWQKSMRDEWEYRS